jgi:hypothetical protein
MIPALELSLQFGTFGGAAAHKAVLAPARVRKWVGMALATPAEIAVRIVGQAEGQRITRTCWCMGRCMRRATTTRRASGRRWRWRRWRSCCWARWGFRIRIEPRDQRTVTGIVTGPSFTRCTCISAANSPVCTTGCAARAFCTKYS